MHLAMGLYLILTRNLKARVGLRYKLSKQAALTTAQEPPLLAVARHNFTWVKSVYDNLGH